MVCLCEQKKGEVRFLVQKHTKPPNRFETTDFKILYFILEKGRGRTKSWDSRGDLCINSQSCFGLFCSWTVHLSGKEVASSQN